VWNTEAFIGKQLLPHLVQRRVHALHGHALRCLLVLSCEKGTIVNDSQLAQRLASYMMRTLKLLTLTRGS